ncbi:TraR/DksA family transcriptional regulator [Patescibacteria group bacterium]|nr:TraR/DksA family transcriptional regulator [Patescibacteria group bacterium]MBU0879653.1 TraR/DksA family transcriptional regulator [Patescibacteria group bacterium]MBU0880550.1 TraR/DksA family transcriptional regulator [Patescibacteria group bacterium]MBU1783048.1 TraR/DksA family transcriptional regulator [Patescibacteria group bacterium]MBU1991873.1 TraR/DksA family transcriptional regulator [Patescibacteria group bacterium]
MDKKAVDKIKKELLGRKKQIEKDLQSFTKQDIHEKDARHTKFPDYGNACDDSVQEVDDYTTGLATEEVLEEILRDINNALDRIAKNTYGICKYCKKEIDEKRLLARPVANTCVACKLKMQKMV